MTAPLRPGHKGTVWVTDLGGGRHKARCRVKGVDGRTHEVAATGRTPADARRNLDDRIIARSRDDAFLLTNPGAVTVAEVAGLWLEAKASARTVKSSTISQYRAVLKQVILPEIGEVPMATVTRVGLKTVLKRIAEGKRSGRDERGNLRRGRPVTGRQPETVLGMVTRFAWDSGILDHDPLASRGRERRVDARVDPDAPLEDDEDGLRHLDVDEVGLLVDLLVARENPERRGRGINPTLRWCAGIQLGTGLRIGEAVALRWRDLVHNLDGTVTVWVTGTFVEPRDKGEKPRRGKPKTKSSYRAVVCGPDVAALFSEIRSKSKRTAPGDYVLATAKSTMPAPSNLRTSWRKTVQGTVLADTTPHDLRKTFGERIRVAHGMDAAQAALGHGTRAITEGHYTKDSVQPVGAILKPSGGLLPEAV